MFRKIFAVGIAVTLIAPLSSAFAQQLQEPKTPFSFLNTGELIIQQVPDLQNEVGTREIERSIFTEEGELITQTCLQHRMEPSLEILRRYLTCTESRSAREDRVFQEMYIGNTYFRKDDEQPWFQYDLSTSIPDESHYFRLAETNAWRDRQYIRNLSEVEFVPGKTEEQGIWDVLTPYFPMPLFRVLMSNYAHEWIQTYDFIKAFSTSPVQMTGSFIELGKTNSGLFVLTGESEMYSALSLGVVFGDGVFSFEAVATPKNQSAETPALNYQILTESGKTIAKFEKSRDSSIKSLSGYTVEQGELRPLELAFEAPAGAILASNDINTGYDPCVHIQFKDICGHWSQTWIGRAYTVRYIGVYKYGDNPDYLLLPDMPIARAEFVHLLDASHSYDMFLEDTFGGPLLDYVNNPAPYTPTDVDEKAWYIVSIRKAINHGVAVFQGKNAFRPNDTLNRAETMTFLARIIDHSLNRGKTSVVQDYYSKWLTTNSGKPFAYFPDVALDSWFAPYVVFMYDMNLLDHNQPTFRPGSSITRAEAITLIERLRQRMPYILGMNF